MSVVIFEHALVMFFNILISIRFMYWYALQSLRKKLLEKENLSRYGNTDVASPNYTNLSSIPHETAILIQKKNLVNLP